MSPGEPSPRTDAEPMAFTPDEFLRGAVAAWLAFNLLFDLLYAAMAIVTSDPRWGPLTATLGVLLIYAVPIALVVSGVVTLLLCGAAWWLGRLLRRHRRPAVHVIAFAMLGAAIGLLAVGTFELVTARSLDLGNGLALITIASSAAALPLGWAWTVRRSRRAEAGTAQASRPDLAEAAER